ncbi:MAG: hypothetical protein AAGB18_09110 [Pseudomonadota bacterium]
MHDRDVAFDLLLELADFTLDQDLPKTSMRIEAALDAFLEETGRAARGAGASAPPRKARPRRTSPRVLPAR